MHTPICCMDTVHTVAWTQRVLGESSGRGCYSEGSLMKNRLSVGFFSHLMDTVEAGAVFPQTLAALAAQGKVTGVVVDVGDLKSTVSVAIDGVIIPGTAKKVAIGGRNVTK